jgi:hypothetical protein
MGALAWFCHLGTKPLLERRCPKAPSSHNKALEPKNLYLKGSLDCALFETTSKFL